LDYQDIPPRRDRIGIGSPGLTFLVKLSDFLRRFLFLFFYFYFQKVWTIKEEVMTKRCVTIILSNSCVSGGI